MVHERALWSVEPDLVLVESYGSDQGGVVSPAELPATEPGPDGVRLVGALVVPGDEVVLYLIASPSIAAVKRFVESAGLQVIRIVPATWATPPRDAQGR